MENIEITPVEILSTEEKLNDALERIDILEERLNSSQLFSESFRERAIVVTGYVIFVFLVFGVAFGIWGILYSIATK